MSDAIDRQAAINAVDSETVSTNPEHFKSSEEFIKFMDDADIASFGKWQWANGFNTALVATTIQLKKLPFAQPETYKEKLKEIADELSEKFAYLNTCPNERDIILGYLGVERPRGTHCDTDCIITKCECNHHYTKSLSAQPESKREWYQKGYKAGYKDGSPEIIRCKDCEYIRIGGVDDGSHWYYCDQTDCDTEYDGYCFRAKKRK